MADLKISQLAAANTPVTGNERIPCYQSGSPETVFLTSTQVASLAQGSATRTTQSGTTYTPVAGDAQTKVAMTSSSANSFQIPTNAAVAYPIGTTIIVEQYGPGQTTVTASGGVTQRVPFGAKIAAQYASTTLTKVGTDEWINLGATTT